MYHETTSTLHIMAAIILALSVSALVLPLSSASPTSSSARLQLPPSQPTLHESGAWNFTNVRLPDTICPTIILSASSSNPLVLSPPLQDNFDPAVWYFACAIGYSLESNHIALVSWREGANHTRSLLNTTNTGFVSVVQSDNGTLYVISLPAVDDGLTTPVGVLSVDPAIGMPSLRTIVPFNASDCPWPQMLQIYGSALIVSCLSMDQLPNAHMISVELPSNHRKIIFPLGNIQCTSTSLTIAGWISLSNKGELLVICGQGVFSLQLGSFPTPAARMMAVSDPTNPITSAWRDTASLAIFMPSATGLIINRTDSGDGVIVWPFQMLKCNPSILSGENNWWQAGRVLFLTCDSQRIVSLPADIVQVQDIAALIAVERPEPFAIDRRDGMLWWTAQFGEPAFAGGGLVTVNGRSKLTLLRQSQCLGMTDVVSDAPRSVVHVGCSTDGSIASLRGGVLSKFVLPAAAGCNRISGMSLRQDGTVDVLCWTNNNQAFVVGVANVSSSAEAQTAATAEAATFVWQYIPTSTTEAGLWSTVRGPLIVLNSSASYDPDAPVSLYLLPSTNASSISSQGVYVFSDAFAPLPQCQTVDTLAEFSSWLFVGCGQLGEYSLFALPWGNSAVLPGALQPVLSDSQCGSSILDLWPDTSDDTLWVACAQSLLVLQVKETSWSWVEQTYALPPINSLNVDNSFSFGMSRTAHSDMAFVVDANLTAPSMVIVDIRRGDVWRVPVCADYASFVIGGNGGVSGGGDGTPYIICADDNYMMALSPSFLCLPGSAWLGNSCSSCNIGSARDLKSADTFQWYAPQCQTCAPNFIAPVASSEKCQPCPEGSVQPNLQTQSCQFCQRNTCPYSQDPSSLPTCTACDAGFEAPQSGSASCSPCMLGSLSAKGEPCIQCAGGSYAPAANASVCASCIGGSEKEGLSCTGGIASVLKDHWAYLWPPSSELGPSDSQSFQTTKCPPTGLCPGSALQAAPNVTLTLCLPPRLNDPSNWLCSQCEAGYLPWGNQCDSCTGANVPMILGAIAAALALTVFMLVSGSSAAGQVSTLLYFVQIAALQLPPGSEAEWMSWIAVVNPGAKSVKRCIAPLSPLQQYALTFAFPLILFVALLVVGSIHFALRAIVRRGDAVNSNDSSRLQRLAAACRLDSYISCSLSLCLFSYTSVSVAVVESLNCVEIAPGVRRLFAAPTVDCNASGYHTFLPLSITVLVLFVIGFPLVTLMFLGYHHRRIGEGMNQQVENIALKEQLLHSMQDDPTEQLSPSSPQQQVSLSPFTLRYGALFLSFRTGAWYWQAGILLRRFALAVVSVMLASHPTQQYVVYASLHLVFFVFHLLTQPFESAQMNYVDSAVYLLLIAQANILAATDSPDSPSFPVQLTVFLLVVLPTLALVAWTVQSKKSLISSVLKQAKEVVARIVKSDAKPASPEVDPELSYTAPIVAVLGSATSTPLAPSGVEHHASATSP